MCARSCRRRASSMYICTHHARPFVIKPVLRPRQRACCRPASPASLPCPPRQLQFVYTKVCVIMIKITSMMMMVVVVMMMMMMVSSGDVRDALQCLRFDGFQTGVMCREWHLGEQQRAAASGSAAPPVRKRAGSEVKRHLNAVLECKREALSPLDPRCFSLLAHRAGVEPEQMIYLDSRAEVARAAQEAGMSAIICQSGAHGVKQLEAMLALPLTNFAWSRDVYAKVLWVSNKDCQTHDA